MTYIRLRHIILFLLMAVFVTPIRASFHTDYLMGGALTLKNGRIDKYYFEGGFARALETSATTDRVNHWDRFDSLNETLRNSYL